MHVARLTKSSAPSVEDVLRVAYVMTGIARGYVQIVRSVEYVVDLCASPGTHQRMDALHKCYGFATLLDSPRPMRFTVRALLDFLDLPSSDNRLESFQDVQVARPHRHSRQFAAGAPTSDEERTFAFKKPSHPRGVYVGENVHVGHCRGVPYGWQR